MILDTNGSMLDPGTYNFRVTAVPEMTDVKGYQAWQFTFEAMTDEGPQTYNERFMVWLLAPLIRGLGFDEPKPGKFEFEPSMALGRSVTATIAHVVLDKGASAGKVVARMQNIQPAKKMSPENRAAMKVQAPAEEEIPF